MLNQFGEQFKNALGPFNTLAIANAKSVETLATQQTALFTSVLNDNLAYSQKLESQKDVVGLFNTHKEYLETVQKRLTDSVEETYAVFNKSGETVTNLFTGVLNK